MDPSSMPLAWPGKSSGTKVGSGELLLRRLPFLKMLLHRVTMVARLVCRWMSGSACNPGEGSAGFLAEAGSWLHHFLGQDEVPLDLPLVFNRVYNSGPLPPWSGQLRQPPEPPLVGDPLAWGE